MRFWKFVDYCNLALSSHFVAIRQRPFWYLPHKIIFIMTVTMPVVLSHNLDQKLLDLKDKI